MKQLCMINYVWGSYQMYIPIYLLFLGVSYPEYDARIYVDGKLSESVKQQLQIVKQIYSNFCIIENHDRDCRFTELAKKDTQIMRSQRWLNYEPMYAEYEALYFGDIDILICKEKESIFDNHEVHCQSINRVYSNAARPPIPNKEIKISNVNYFIKKYGFWQTMDCVFNRKKVSLRYSGLHYVKTKPYFQAVLPLVDYFCIELEKMAHRKKSIFNAYNFNNEELLRELIKKAGLGDCYLVDVLDNPYELGYRPDHGLHLGRYRGVVPVSETESFLKRHEVFWFQYKEIKKTKEYIAMEKFFEEELKAVLKNMEMSFQEM